MMMMMIFDHQSKKHTSIKRKISSYLIDDVAEIKQKMLNLSKRFNIFCFLDSCQYPNSNYEFIIGAGVIKSFKSGSGNTLAEFEKFQNENNDWMFGHIGYDIKNEIEQLCSNNFDGVKFPDLFFFIPQYVITLKGKKLVIETPENDADEIFQRIYSESISAENSLQKAELTPRYSKKAYLDVIEKLKQHIQRGDCYEITFCQEFYSDNIVIDPLELYTALIHISPNPFAAFYKLDDKYLMCASPERFIAKDNNRIFSQPIKGTSKRDLKNKTKDQQQKDLLLSSIKERSENVMIVDLVRNDLSKICKEGTVKVDELFGIYSFPQVHQMISTISGEAAPVSFSEILRATFPMGSMTGAPKKRVMELIENYELTKRGLFSGSVGYIDPENNFDYNVIIRSLLYNLSEKYLSAQVGSAITFYSNAEDEYEECLLKVSAIKNILS